MTTLTTLARTRRRVVASPHAVPLGAALVLAACVHRGGALAGYGPRLDAITPDAVVVGPGRVVDVVLTGHDFFPGAPGHNTIVFDGTLIPDVPASADGTRIRFTMPTVLRRAAEAPPAALQPGTYTIAVRTPAGESNRRTLEVMP